MRWELGDEDDPAVLRWRMFWLRDVGDESTPETFGSFLAKSNPYWLCRGFENDEITYPPPQELLCAARRQVRTTSQNENEIAVKSQFCARVSTVARRVKA